MPASNGSIKRLGERLKNGEAPTNEDLGVLLEWTGSFALPMQAFYLDLRSLLPLEGDKSSCRIKCLPSLLSKNLRIKAENQMSTTGDITGLRIISRDMAQLERLREELEKKLALYSAIGADFVVLGCRIKDYIKFPSSTGYRAVHFRLSLLEKSSGKRYRMELQLRTRREHAWAQAVETVDALRRIDFKHDALDGFFCLLGDALARRDGVFMPAQEGETIRKLVELDRLNHYIQDLEEFDGGSFRSVGNSEDARGNWHLLGADMASKEKSCERFEDLCSAWEKYKGKALEGSQRILVFTRDPDCISDLYRAYCPSEDMGLFSEILEIVGRN